MRQEPTSTDGSRRYRHFRLGGDRQEPTATDARRPQCSSIRPNTPKAPACGGEGLLLHCQLLILGFLQERMEARVVAEGGSRLTPEGSYGAAGLETAGRRVRDLRLGGTWKWRVAGHARRTLDRATRTPRPFSPVPFIDTRNTPPPVRVPAGGPGVGGCDSRRPRRPSLPRSPRRRVLARASLRVRSRAA